MATLWAVNPRRRRRKMSAKQRKYFGGGKRKRRSANGRRHRRNAAVAAVATPVIRRRRRGKRVVSRRRRRSGGMRGMRMSGALGMLKQAAVGGAGAIAVDMAMGQVARFLPASLATPVDSSGQPQYGYFAAKAALAIALGTYGTRLPVVGRYAPTMGMGALTVLAYQFLRPMAAQVMALGYFNPAPTQRPGMGKYVSRVGAYATPLVRQNSDSGKGARASSVLSMVSRERKGA